MLSATGFWDYSVECYSHPEVKQGCLLLQDEYGLNVNLILFCLWQGEVHHCSVAREFFVNDMQSFHDLDKETIKPLRRVRRQFKNRYGDNDIYKNFLSVELSLEKFAQNIIVESAQKSTHISFQKNNETALKNLLNYCAAENIKITKDISRILKEKILLS